jgi:hypothetical protein
MSPLRAVAIAAYAILALVVWTDPVLADCLNSHAVDACLVGTWKQTGGGAAEWMRQNMKMAQVSVSASNNMLTFNGDGTFSTSTADASAHVVAKEGAPLQATGHMTAQGNGQWSVVDGKLNLCVTAVDSSGSIQMQGDHGMTTKVPMPQMKPSASSVTYRCDGDTMSTVQPMPHNTTMSTTYAKVR